MTNYGQKFNDAMDRAAGGSLGGLLAAVFAYRKWHRVSFGKACRHVWDELPLWPIR